MSTMPNPLAEPTHPDGTAWFYPDITLRLSNSVTGEVKEARTRGVDQLSALTDGESFADVWERSPLELVLEMVPHLLAPIESHTEGSIRIDWRTR